MGKLDTAAVGQALLESVTSQFKDFLAENKAAAAFVAEVSADYAGLLADLQLAKDPEAQAAVLSELRRVENTLELEADALAIVTNRQIAEQIKSALKIVLAFATKTLVPLALAAI